MLLLDPQELEYLLEHLGHPETLKEKKFQEWLLDNDHRQLFERVRDYREAYLRVDKGEMIDLAKEWEQFEVNVQKKSRWGMRRICRCCQCPYIPPDRYALAADRNRNGEGGPGGGINR